MTRMISLQAGLAIVLAIGLGASSAPASATPGSATPGLAYPPAAVATAPGGAAPMAVAAAAAATGCSYASAGPQAPAICWLDFAGFNAAQAMTAAGQHFRLSLPGGYFADFDVNTSGGNAAGVRATAQGSNSGWWSGYYPGVTGQPILGRTATGTTSIRISRFVVTDALGVAVPNFGMVAGDGESTSSVERLTMTTSGTPWQLVGRTGLGCAANIGGLGSQTVTCYGNPPQSPGAYGTAVFSTTNPSSYSVGLVDPGTLGTQAAVFGFQTATLTLNKSVAGRVDPGDSFDTTIVSAQGSVLGAATTGSGTSSTTGPITLLPGTQPYTMREAASPGSTSLVDYLQSWTCTNANTQSTTVLPSGTGTAKSIVLGIGDVVTCTVTNTPGTPALTIDKVFNGNADEDASGSVSLGDTLSYSVTATSTGNVRATGVVVSDDLSGATRECATVPIGGTCALSTSWVVTQSDVDAGSVVNTGSAVADRVAEVVDADIVAVPQNPELALDKILASNADQDASGTVSLGDALTYSVTATNTGDTTLTGVVVSDELTGATKTCPSVAPGGTCVLSTLYIVGQADADAGSVENTATATADQLPGPVTDTATAPIPQNPALSVAKSASPSDVASYVLGAEITYSFVVTNTGNVTIADVAVVEGEFTGVGAPPVVGCPAATTLAPREQLTCTATYTLVQGDIDAGTVQNTAMATGVDPIGNSVESPQGSFEIPANQTPALSLDKFVGPGLFTHAGQVVPYFFRVTNTGNVTLSGVTVTDDPATFTGSGSLSPITCPSGALIPGESVTCAATYVLSQEDIDSGSVDNTASAAASGPDGIVSAPPDTEQLRIPPAPGLSMVKSVSPTEPTTAGEMVTYSFVVSNTGNVTLRGVSVDEGSFSGTGPVPTVVCPSGATELLAPGDDVTCTATYTLTQADVDAGGVTNEATASGAPPTGDRVTSPVGMSELVLAPRPGLTISKAATPTTVARAGDPITYTFVVTNIGNVTLRGVTVGEGSFSGAGVVADPVCPSADLPPAGEITCTATYSPIQADIDVGRPITNTAFAAAVTPAGVDVSSSESNQAVVDIVATAALELEIEVDRSSVQGVGQRLEYRFEVTNVGAVTLGRIEIVAVSFSGSGPVPMIVCPIEEVAPGESIVCTAVYFTTAEDVVAGEVSLTAAAVGTTREGLQVTAPQDAADTRVLPAPVAAPGGGLPLTGATVGILPWLGLSAVLVGALLLRVRRRARSVTEHRLEKGWAKETS